MTPQEQRNKRFDEKFQYHGFRDNAENEFHSNLLKSHLTLEVHLAIEQVEKWALIHNYDSDMEFTEKIVSLSDLLAFLKELKK